MDIRKNSRQEKTRDIGYFGSYLMLCGDRRAILTSTGDRRQNRGSRSCTLQGLQSIATTSAVEDNLVTNKNNTVVEWEPNSVFQSDLVFFVQADTSSQYTSLNYTLSIGAEVPISLKVLQQVLTET